MTPTEWVGMNGSHILIRPSEWPPVLEAADASAVLEMMSIGFGSRIVEAQVTKEHCSVVVIAAGEEEVVSGFLKIFDTRDPVIMEVLYLRRLQSYALPLEDFIEMNDNSFHLLFIFQGLSEEA